MEDISPEMLEQLISLGAIPEEQAAILRQMQMAQELRTTPIPKGGMAGRVYVADPFGAMAAGYDRYKGAKQMKALEGKHAGTVDRQTAGRKSYWDLLRQRGGMQQPGMQPNGVVTNPVP